LDEADGDGVGDSVGGRLICVEDTVELSEIGLVLGEQRASKHIAQEKNNADDFVSLDTAGNNPLREVPGVGLKGFESFRFERFDVAVVHGSRFGEDFLLGHRGEQPSLRDSPDPFLA
jgi:hypothetical protein